MRGRHKTTLAVRDQPAYTLAEAARYLRLPAATLRSWVVGRGYPTASGTERFHPLIHPPEKRPPVLSFSNLIEAHVLRALRTEHGVSVKAVRKSLHYAEQTLGIERLLLRGELCTQAGEVFLERYGKLISLSASGQLAMRRIFDEHLKRVVWNKEQFPARLYPFLSADGLTGERPIAIDPQIAFGRPIVLRKGISTRVIAERIDAGETVRELAADYDLFETEIEDAVLYERAA
jgi:uncharacterized protein (DUF433 family)